MRQAILPAPQAVQKSKNDHRPLIDIYKSADSIHGVKKSFIGSGIRYDLIFCKKRRQRHQSSEQKICRRAYIKSCVRQIESSTGAYRRRRIKLHAQTVVRIVSEVQPSFESINKKYNLRQQLIPYFISSHPACHESDMAELASITKHLNFHLEQVQDFTPTPMTLSTEIYYTGIHPYTMQPVYTAKSQTEKKPKKIFLLVQAGIQAKHTAITIENESQRFNQRFVSYAGRTNLK